MYPQFIKDQIAEFEQVIKEDPTLDSVAKDIEYIGHCPGINTYRTWLFKYKNILVMLNDEENGLYSYLGCLNNYMDEIVDKATKSKLR